MFKLEKYIRPNILDLKPYSSARDEFQGQEGIFLDANENPYGTLNRYPDPYQKALKAKLAKLKKMQPKQIFIGNGSDEVIDLAFRIFCEPGKDKVIVCPPTYGMYEVSAHINAIEVVQVPLDSNFQLDLEQILKLNRSSKEVKMVFICSPNNPTGNKLEQIETLAKQFKGIVFVDEAYIDFSIEESLLPKLKQFPNLIVSQTLSKAWGKASLRIGMAFASPELIGYFNKVKPPYNVSAINQAEAINTLANLEEFNRNVQTILEQRKVLAEQLAKLAFVEKIYPSDANFLLVKTRDANTLYNYLVGQKIVVRNRHSVVANCLRISIGKPEENQKLIQTLKQL